MAEKRVGTLAVYLTANSQGVKKGFDQAKGYVSQYAKWALSIAGGASVAALVKSSLAAWGVQEQAEKRLAAVLKSTSYAAGLSQKQIQDYASELQKTTTYGDEAIIAMQTRLLTFGNLAGENFKRATALILDMAQATGQSAEGITAMVGKALADPARYASVMGRAGVNLTKEQIAEIKKLVAAGKTYEAQLIILDEMQKKFGGTAAAAADTTTGRMIQMKNAWGDVQEQVGRFLASVLSIKDQAGGVTSVFSGWSTSLSENMGILTEETLTYWAYLKYVLTLGWSMIKGIFTMVGEGFMSLPKYFTALWDLWQGLGKDIATLITNIIDYAWKKITGKKVNFEDVFKFDSAMIDPLKTLGGIAKSVYIDPINGMADAAGAAEGELMAGLARAINKRNEIGREEQKKSAMPTAAVSAAAPEMRTVSEARKLVSAELFGSVEAYRTIKKAGLGDLQYKQVQIAEKQLGKLGEIADNTGNAPELVEAM